MKDTYYPRRAVTRLLLDLDIQDVQKSVTVTQGDTNRRLDVTLVDGGRSFAVPDTWTAAFVGVLPSDDELVAGCEIRDGRVVLEFSNCPEVAQEPGTYIGSFDVFDEDGNVVASPKIWMNVMKSTRRFEQDLTIQRLSLLQEFVEKSNQGGNET